MANEFEAFSNPDFDLGYQNQTDATSYALGFAEAAVVDFGASVWNSVAPDDYAVDTRELLEKTGTSALSVYDENPDAIHTASFIGGIFVPAGLALKGMNLARAGVKGAGWFSNTGKAAQSARLEALFKEGKEATGAYRELKRTAIARSLANNTLDATAMELAIVGTLNAHPFMEDYMDDPAKHFAISTALGGVIGGGIGVIADRALLRASESKITMEALEPILGTYKAGIEGMPRINKLQVQQENIRSLEAIMAQQDAAPLTKQYAENMLMAERADQIELFNTLGKDLLQGTSKADQEALMQKLVNDPRFIGVDAVRYAHFKDGLISFKAPGKITLNDTVSFKDFFKVNKDTGVTTAKTLAYSQAFDKIGSATDISHIGRAVDAGLTPKTVTKGWHSMKDTIKVPQTDAYADAITKASAEVDALFATRLAHIDKLDAATLAKAAVAPDDIFTLNGLVARAMRDPDAVANATIKLTRAEPNYDTLAKRIFKSEGVSADHHAKMLEFTNPVAIKSFDMLGRNSSVGSDALALLSGWRSGTKVAEMRTAADAFFRGGFGGQSHWRDVVGAMYNSAESKALRDKFRALADAEGNVYLWRGMRRDPRGHAALESYTTDIQKAKEFGTPRLFKVHVDDILGAIADIGSKDGIMRNEIIVGAPARQIEAALPVMTQTGMVQNLSHLASSTQEVSYAEAHRLLINLKQDMIDSMIKQGFPAETMAIRTNTPVDTIKAYQAAGGTKMLDELELPYMEYSSMSKMDEYLANSKRTVLLRSNVKKIPFAELKANLDAKLLMQADTEIKADMFASSKSSIAKMVGNYFFAKEKLPLLDMLRAQVAKAVPENAGNKFFQSADFYVRNMAEFGKIASVVGKDIQHLANAAVSSVMKPIAEGMNAVVAKGPAALSEFNSAMAFNAQLKGYRIYKDGQFWQKVQKLNAEGKKVTELEPATFDGRVFKIVTPEVDNLMKELATAGKEMYEMAATKNKILGLRGMNDLGFWVPPFNPTSKWITYAHDKATATTKLLWGNTKEQMDSAVASFKAANAEKHARGDLLIFDKGQQELVNKFVGRDDPFTMQVANVEAFHGGSSAPAIVPLNRDILEQIATGYEHYVIAGMRNLADISLSDVTGVLHKMAQMEDLATKNQPLNAVQKFLGKQQNTARIMHNTLLGVSNLGEFTTWKAANTTFENTLGWATDKVSKIWKSTTDLMPMRMQKALTSKEAIDLKELDYKVFAQKLEAEGIYNPYAVFDDHIAQKIFGVAKLQESKDVSKRLVYAGNALAATVALRFGELAQPIVNAMSLPILSMSAMASKLPPTFMGAKLATAKVHPVAAMYEGVRAAFGNVPLHKGWDKRWAAAGYYDPLVSEATEVLRMARQFEPGAVSRVERGLNSTFVRTMSKPADFSESMVRRIAMFTGGNLAKRMYPELDDVGITIFARDFMDRVIGNYHAAQRPTMFGGTLGVAMGLFQTYMVTMAQSIYRHLELKDYKALMAMMTTQAGIFGTGSLPGFHQISSLIGEHFSDNNVDLVSGTFRAVPDPMANMLLYGVPSSMGPAFYSRGELAPRIPGGPGEFPAVNMAMQAIQGVSKVASAIGAQDGDAGRAMMEALSMQSISRPLARISEIADGYSVTREGNTIAVPEEVWTPVGIMSRLLSMRPLQEAKLRDAIHMKNVYGSIDYEERQAATAQLKTALRNGTLTDEKLADIAEKYLRTGTPQGWRSAVNTAIAQTNTSGRETFLNKLQADNPLMYMIDALDD